ncbi:checkpoint protein HUS1 [Pimephales promelas]|nr:checkpoint protein HUS1 [Pimephales promelas]
MRVCVCVGQHICVCVCVCVCVQVSIYLPPLKTMRSVVDRMKNLSNYLVMEANMNGEMNLKIETELVSVTTHFKELGNPPWGVDGSQSTSASHRDSEFMAQTRLDIRKLQQFLTGQQVNPSRAMCSKITHTHTHTCPVHTLSILLKKACSVVFDLDIVHNRVLHLIFLHEDVSLQYFIPAVA